MIAKFLGSVGLAGLKNWIWIALVSVLILLMIMGIKIGSNWFDRAQDDARALGGTEAVVAGQNQTLEQLGDANDAEQDLHAGGERSTERYVECLRNSLRKPACERYNPNPG